jgi:hypothetical protein
MASDPKPDAACGPPNVAFKVTLDKTQHPTPAPPGGKAMLYVFGYGTLAIDGEWVGAVSGVDNYFPLPIDPGEHHLCARFDGRSAYGPQLSKIKGVALHSLDAKSGQTYYVDIRETSGSSPGFALDLIDPDEGRYRLASSTFSTSRPK